MLVTGKGRVGDKKTTLFLGRGGGGGGGRGLDGKTLGERFVRDSLKGKVSQPFCRLLCELENTALPLSKRLRGNIRTINDCT